MKIIKISDNRRFNITNIVVGYLEENKEEVLEFEIPEKYSEYGKKACFSANGQTFAKTFDDIISNKLTITRDISQFKELDMTIAFFKIEGEDEIIARTSILHILIENAIVCDDDVKPDEPKIIVLDNLIDEVTKLDVLVTKNEEKREEYYQEIQEKVDNGDFNGATFKPSVDSEGNLSFTNDKGLDNPETVNIRGPQGADYIFTEQDKKEVVNETYKEIKPELDKIESNVNIIEEKIPNQATKENQLADKDFVNSSINSITAFYITKDSEGNQFNSKEELDSSSIFYSGGIVRVPTRNDYCIVLEDETKENATTRYIYQNNQWEFQYIVNETALTSEQVKALNSGITLELVAKLQGIDLTDYVKNTDYAGKNDEASGIVTPKYYYCFLVSGATGIAYCPVRTYNDYKSSNVANEAFISKGTLENVITGKELVNKTYVDDLVGNIDTLLTDLNSGGGVE